MDSTREKASYCIGYETGRNLMNQFSDIDMDLLEKGLADGLTNKNAELPDDERQRIMMALRQQVEMQQRQVFAKIAEHNRKTGDDFLKENREKEGVTTCSSGLQYKVIQVGSGPKPILADVATIHYRGSFLDGRIFDSSYERGKPQQFPLSRVIPGWAEVLQLMRVGDKWQVWIPHYLAYGEVGMGNEIGPCTTLVFEIELLGVN